MWQIDDDVVFVNFRIKPRPSAITNTESAASDNPYCVWMDVKRTAVAIKPIRGWSAPLNRISSQIPGASAIAAIPTGPPSPPNSCCVVVSTCCATPGVQAWLSASIAWPNAKNPPAAARAKTICHQAGATRPSRAAA